MTWFRVDDMFWSHPKTLELPVDAVGLWTLAGAWCAGHLTDGKVPASILRRISPASPARTKSLAEELVAAGLWERADDGYQFHQWLDHQPSREKVQSERERSKERQARFKAQRRRNAEPSPSPQRDGNGVTNALPQRHAQRRGNAAPTRPDPTRPITDSGLYVTEVGGTDRCVIENDVRKRSDIGDSDAFSEFWRIATRKTGKGAARRAHAKALTRTGPENLAGAWQQANAAWATWPDKSLVPHPATWLNQERWDDQPPAPHANGTRSKTLAALALAAQLEQDDADDPSRMPAIADPRRPIRPPRAAIRP